MGMLQLPSWQWFDMADPSYGNTEINIMLTGVSSLTKVRAISILFGESVALRQSVEGDRDAYQDWSLFLPLSIDRMSRMSILLPGCFSGWTGEEEVLSSGIAFDEGNEYTDHYSDLWRNLYVALNPNLRNDYRHMQATGRRDYEINDYLHAARRRERVMDFVEGWVDLYDERPAEFTEEQAVVFDIIMDRLNPLESDVRHEF
jgi:hypothetical protein